MLRLNYTKDIILAHNKKIFAVQLDFCTAIFGKQHTITDRQINGYPLARLVALPWSYGYNLAFGRFLFSRIGDDDATSGFFFSFQSLDQNPVIQWTNFHVLLLFNVL